MGGPDTEAPARKEDRPLLYFRKDAITGESPSRQSLFFFHKAI